MAEGARLESVYTLTGIQGSNPCLSASSMVLLSVSIHMQRWTDRYNRYSVTLKHPRGGFLYREGNEEIVIDSEQGINGMLIFPDSIAQLNTNKNFDIAEIQRTIRNLSAVLEENRFPFEIAW